jgi:hypothetical protein
VGNCQVIQGQRSARVHHQNAIKTGAVDSNAFPAAINRQTGPGSDGGESAAQGDRAGATGDAEIDGNGAGGGGGAVPVRLVYTGVVRVKDCFAQGAEQVAGNADWIGGIGHRYRIGARVQLGLDHNGAHGREHDEQSNQQSRPDDRSGSAEAPANRGRQSPR